MITFINSVNGDCDLLGRFINTNSNIIDAWKQHIHKLYIIFKYIAVNTNKNSSTLIQI